MFINTNLVETDLVIISGASGTGKTSAARYLKKFYPQGAAIDVDSLRAILNTQDWFSQKQHNDMLISSISLCKTLLSSGYKPIILVDTFNGADDKLESWLASINYKVFRLFTEQSILKDRLKVRSENNGPEHIEKLLLFADKQNNCVIEERFERIKENYHYIDTSFLAPSDTADTIYNLLSKIA